MSDEPVTRRLARFLTESRYEDIPPAVRHEASRAALNALGCAIGACRHETVENAFRAVQPFAAAPQAALLGRADRLDVPRAALLNGIAMHVLDFDDTHQRAVHPSAPVLPAVLGYSEWKRLSGRDLVHAYVLGVETEVRVGLSVFPEHYNVGWHITGTAGVFGAAAATGKLLALDEQRMTWALGIAATQSSGLREMFGSMCKSLHPGCAAHDGLMAAVMAGRGFTSSERAIEAPRGFAHVLSTKFDPAVITSGLGERWELSRNMYKPYACGLVVHAAIDACIELKREYELKPEDIESVTLKVGPLVQELTAKLTPQTGLEAKFSIYHAAAAAFMYGAAGETQFSDDVVRDPRVIRVRERVTFETDPSLGKLEAHATVRHRDGRTLHKHVRHALGSVERPMSDRELEEKFRALTDGVLTARRAAQVIDLCWRLETLENAGDLARATVPE